VLIGLALGSAGAGAQLTVSLAGRVVEVQAQLAGETPVGDIGALLKALGLNLERAAGAPGFSVRTLSGAVVEGTVGEARLRAKGKERKCGAPFSDGGDGRVIGPLGDVAEAVGCRVGLNRASGELRITPRLAQVEAFTAKEAALVYLRVTGAADPQLHVLNDPARAYADFPGLSWAGRSETIQTGGAGGLQRVRWSLFQEWPPVTRVVVDLVPGAHADLIPGGFGAVSTPGSPPGRPGTVNRGP
jgi:hypothetical protein